MNYKKIVEDLSPLGNPMREIDIQIIRLHVEPVILEKDAEIEQLKKEIEQLTGATFSDRDYAALKDKIPALYNEIERLKSEVKSLRDERKAMNA